jgi:hypothetical protein
MERMKIMGVKLFEQIDGDKYQEMLSCLFDENDMTVQNAGATCR